MQLEVKFQELKPVESNFEDLKIELKEQLEKYQNLVVVEEDLPKYKQDRANLNKLKKALNDEKVRVKNEFSEPIKAFESQVKELIGMIDDPVKCLDYQLKKYEEKRKSEKKDKIEAKFNELNDIDQIKFYMVFDESWLNVSVTMKKINDSITSYIENVHNEIQAITDLQSDHEEELQKLYLKTFSLPQVLARKNEIDSILAKEKARQKAEEERKAEQDRLEKEKAEREAKEAKEIEEKKRLDEIQRKEDELKAKEHQLQVKEQAIINKDPLPVEDKATEQKIKENNNPEVYAQNNLEPKQIDFRVWVNEKQKIALKSFLIDNQIQFGKVQ